MARKRYPTTLIDSDLWERFINEIGQRKGIRRGVIQESLEEAIMLWISSSVGERHERGNT